MEKIESNTELLDAFEAFKPKLRALINTMNHYRLSKIDMYTVNEETVIGFGETPLYRDVKITPEIKHLIDALDVSIDAIFETCRSRDEANAMGMELEKFIQTEIPWKEILEAAYVIEPFMNGKKIMQRYYQESAFRRGVSNKPVITCDEAVGDLCIGTSAAILTTCAEE